MTERTIAAKRRAIGDLGRQVEIVNFSDSGERDKYGDAAEFTRETITANALVEQSQDPEQVGSQDGSDLQTEVRIFLPSDVEVYKAGDGGDDDTVKASRIKDPSIGREWKVYDIWHDNEGILVVLCRTQ